MSCPFHLPLPLSQNPMRHEDYYGRFLVDNLLAVCNLKEIPTEASIKAFQMFLQERKCVSANILMLTVMSLSGYKNTSQRQTELKFLRMRFGLVSKLYYYFPTKKEKREKIWSHEQFKTLLTETCFSKVNDLVDSHSEQPTLISLPIFSSSHSITNCNQITRYFLKQNRTNLFNMFLVCGCTLKSN